jgi:hypothetical protein
MTNWDLYKILNFVVNKDVYAQAISPSEMQLELQKANLMHFRKRLGLPETYIPGSANEGVGVNRITEGDLLPFLVEETKNPVNGVITLTSTWYYINDFWTANTITAEIMSVGEFSSRQNNYITKPTLLHMAARQVKAGLKVLPTNATGVTVEYYRTPVTPTFVTTVNPVTLELQYGTSVELEWDDGSKLDIVHMILADMGINVARNEVTQYASKLIETGK